LIAHPGARRRPEHPMSMALVAPIDYQDAVPEVRAVHDIRLRARSAR
jgi:hypothetical protein